jgi:hypothetical protein
MYIPKNRIITNLTTSPGEFVYKDTRNPYEGFYWKSYDGKFYTGKTPNDAPVNEIVKLVDSNIIVDVNKPTTELYVTLESSLENDVFTESDILNLNYATLKKIDLSSPPRKLLPSQYYPKPTQDDYNLGAFSRYFVVKSNENIYLEVNKDTYDSINSQSTDWAWELYVPFTILWTLTGERDNVFITNRNITQLTEQRLKRRGLQEFLKQNYLKFYQTNEQNIS